MEGDEFLHTIPAFCGHFNPLPPHGGRLRLIVVLLNSNRFQSTPSAWRETSGCTLPIQFHGISIHSLRMEGDSSHRSSPATPSLFQSTPSAWRETDDGFVYALTGKIFQSTPSAWRETDLEIADRKVGGISIHSLRMEGDPWKKLQKK